MSEMNVDMLPAVFGPAIPESGSLETTAYCQSLYSVQVTLSLYKARRNRRRMAVQLHSVLTSASEVRGQPHGTATLPRENSLCFSPVTIA